VVVVSHKIGFEKALKRLLLTASFSISSVESLPYSVGDVRSNFLLLSLHLIFEILKSILVLLEVDKVFPMQKLRKLIVDDFTGFTH